MQGPASFFFVEFFFSPPPTAFTLTLPAIFNCPAFDVGLLVLPLVLFTPRTYESSYTSSNVFISIHLLSSVLTAAAPKEPSVPIPAPAPPPPEPPSPP